MYKHTYITSNFGLHQSCCLIVDIFIARLKCNYVRGYQESLPSYTMQRRLGANHYDLQVHDMHGA